MMWIALLIALVLSLAALAYVVWPLLKPGPAPILVEDDKLTELLGRKDAVLQAIKDLEFDYHVGKLSEEDYQLYDQRLRRQALGLLQQIEQLTPLTASLDATLEAEIAQRRRVGDSVVSTAKAAPTVAPVQGAAAAGVPAAVSLAVAAPVTAVTAVTAVSSATAATGVAQASTVANGNAGSAPHYCTNCGSRLEAHHKFCANCGTPISA
jgi:hypothetical protein